MEKPKMTGAPEVIGSEYMHWAKTCSGARFNLATSGLGNLKFRELKVTLDDLEITGDSGYGYAPLQQALGARLGLTPDSIVTAAGASFANHLAMAALIRPGDEVLIEQPTYEPLLSLVAYLGAEIKRFARRFEDRFQILPDEIERNISWMDGGSGMLCQVIAMHAHIEGAGRYGVAPNAREDLRQSSSQVHPSGLHSHQGHT